MYLNEWFQRLIYSTFKYGLFDIPDFENAGAENAEDDEDDDDLEAELLALTGESKRTNKQKPKRGLLFGLKIYYNVKLWTYLLTTY